MSKTNSTPAPFAPLPLDWATDGSERRKHETKLRETNRAAIFDALETTGISTVSITFDGYGDSGQIEDIAPDCQSFETLQMTELQFASIPWAKTEPEYAAVSLAKALEELAYDFLSELHGGWQDNDGSYGEFTFDVAARTIALDFNARYVASDNYQHEF